MQGNSNVKRSLTSLSTSLTNVRSRKSWLLLIFFICFVLYLASSYLLPAHKHFHQSELKVVSKVASKKTCLDQHLAKWTELMALNDAIIKKIPASATENQFYPFSGNGHLAFGMEKKKMKFYLNTTNHGYVSSYVPTIEYKLKEVHTLENQAVVMDLKGGIVLVISSFDVENSCVIVEETFFVHRLRSDVSFHRMKVHNLGPFPVEIVLRSRDTKYMKSIDNVHTSSSPHADTVSGEVKTKKNKEGNEGSVKFVTVLSKHPASMMVRQGSESTVSMVALTEFQFHPNLKKKSSSKTATKAIKTKQRRHAESGGVEVTGTQPTTAVDEESKWIKELLGKLSHVLHEALLKEHENAWNKLWEVGITLTSDNDPNSPSPLNVNLTEYYMYASHTYNLTSLTSSKSNPKEVSSSSAYHCYTGRYTLHTPKQWVVPTSLSNLVTQVTLWRNFFRENGCGTTKLSCDTLPHLIASSVIGLLPQPQQLQVAFNPLNLRTNVTVRGVALQHLQQSRDHVNIQIVVTNNNHIEPFRIYVSNTGPRMRRVYGCGSACEHVVELGGSTLKFAIHPTNPVTPLFYMSTNRTHLESIRHAKFIQDAVHSARESKAAVGGGGDGHHMKLSPKFWISVVVLIVSFHVVVLKMIYNECRKSRASGNRRTPLI